jgi:hypothetical protein
MITPCIRLQASGVGRQAKGIESMAIKLALYANQIILNLEDYFPYIYRLGYSIVIFL